MTLGPILESFHQPAVQAGKTATLADLIAKLTADGWTVEFSNAKDSPSIRVRVRIDDLPGVVSRQVELFVGRREREQAALDVLAYSLAKIDRMIERSKE